MFGKRWIASWFLGDQSYIEFGGGPKIEFSTSTRISSSADLRVTYGIDFYKDIGVFTSMNLEAGLEWSYSTSLGFRFGLVNEW
ncbi:MAG: hypothetical protein IJR50_07550 [Treponema sp.]|nr:hypothetical protein [Treponema sp.]